MFPVDLKEELGRWWVVLRPIALSISAAAAIFSVVLDLRTGGADTLFLALDVWWLRALLAVILCAGGIVTIRRALSPGRARAIVLGITAVGCAAYALHAFVSRVPIAPLEIHVYPFAPEEFDTRTLRHLAAQHLAEFEPPPIQIRVHPRQGGSPDDVRAWLREKRDGATETRDQVHLALLSTQLDGLKYTDLFSTSGKGWGIISTHRWNLVRAQATDIDTYQYLLHQITLVGIKAFRPLRDLKRPESDVHDGLCMFDNRVGNVTTKPESILVPRICELHREALERLLGSGTAIQLDQFFGRIATRSSSDQIPGS